MFRGRVAAPLAAARPHDRAQGAAARPTILKKRGRAANNIQINAAARPSKTQLAAAAKYSKLHSKYSIC